jgi:predicted metalloprotease with PDZ domain
MPLFRSLCLLLLTLPTLLPAAVYEYTLKLLPPHTHTLAIELAVEADSQPYLDFQMATWRPGRYIYQDYAAAVSHFFAQTADGKPLRWHKVSPSAWRVYPDGEEVRISYRYFANNQDAGSSYFTNNEIYFNPINCFMYLKDRMEGDVRLSVPDLPSGWEVATALAKGKKQNEYLARDWHEFADSPTVFSPDMKKMQFEIDGVQFYLHFQGDYQGDKATDEAALATVEKICREQASVFGGFPFEDYHFIYRLLPYQMRHAVEHSRSSSYALPARITGSPAKIISGIGGITAHEFWHVWNVKRIRPAALVPYDYSQAQYSSLHWLTEGVTDYYTHLMLVRAGVQEREYLFRQLGRTIESLENSYASAVVSPAQSSFDSWLAISPYAHPQHRISYYTLGSRLGLLIDLELRAQTKGEKSLDDVFRYFFATYYQQGKGIPEEGVQTALETISGQSWEDFFQKYVHGTESPDYASLLEPFGLEIEITANENAGMQRLGILNLEARSSGLLVRRIHPGGDAYLSGIAEGDLLVALDGKNLSKNLLEETLNDLEKGQRISLTVARANLPLQEIKLSYRASYTPRAFKIAPNKRLKPRQKKMLEQWLRSGR